MFLSGTVCPASKDCGTTFHCFNNICRDVIGKTLHTYIYTYIDMYIHIYIYIYVY